MNQEYLCRLVRAMYVIQDFPALDEYGSRIFGRPIKGTWKLFRHIAKTAVADVWEWSDERELASYPSVEVPPFEEFATLILHEVTHGWCFFLKGNSSLLNYPTGVDEEQVCWDISKLVCEMLDISYQGELAELPYQFYRLWQAEDIDELKRLVEKLPEHLQF